MLLSASLHAARVRTSLRYFMGEGEFSFQSAPEASSSSSSCSSFHVLGDSGSLRVLSRRGPVGSFLLPVDGGEDLPFLFRPRPLFRLCPEIAGSGSSFPSSSLTFFSFALPHSCGCFIQL